MIDRLKSIYVWLTIPLLAWLLNSHVESRFYREHSVAYNVSGFLTHLELAEHEIKVALNHYENGNPGDGRAWLEMAEVNLHVVDSFARSYGTALNRRFSSRHYGFSYRNVPETAYQTSILKLARYESLQEGTLSDRTRARLEAIAADIQQIRTGLSEELLLKTDGKEVTDRFREIGEELTFPPLMRQP